MQTARTRNQRSVPWGLTHPPGPPDSERRYPTYPLILAAVGSE
jgi:hypothetical protein